MPWLRFTAAHDHVPPSDRRITMAYEPGQIRNVTRACAEEALRLGRAVRSSRAEAQADGDRSPPPAP